MFWQTKHCAKWLKSAKQTFACKCKHSRSTRSRYSGLFNVISVINLGFWSELCAQRILTLWGRVYLLELEWKCQSLSYFSPPPLLRGSCKTCDVCRRLYWVCVCACGGSHVPSPARVQPCDAGPVAHPASPPWLLLCRNTWLHIRNSLNAGAEVCRQPTHGRFKKMLLFS